RFEDLPVWRAAIKLGVEVYRLTRPRWFADKADVRDQMRRAALSISNNIAEGFERGTTSELLMFLYIARGSAGEVRSGCHFCTLLLEEGVTYETPDLRSGLEHCVASCEAVARQIRAWAQSLQDGDIPGQRHLTADSKQQYQRARRAVELETHIRRVTEENIQRSMRQNSRKSKDSAGPM
ncbi:MAG: four helix bundle protein, partial [Phycisphaerae bacterium]